MIVGAGFSAASSALVRECYDYVDLCSVFVEEDVAAYEMFRQGGVVQAWLADPLVRQLGGAGATPAVELTAQWQVAHADLLAGHGTWQSMREVSEGGPYYLVRLMATGPADLSSRETLVRDFRAVFPRYVRKIELAKGECQLVVSPLAWHGVERRLETFAACLGGAFIQGPGGHFGRCTITYQHDAAADGYVVVPPEPSC